MNAQLAKRRKVVRVAVVYSVVAWLIVEIVTAVEAPLNLPGWMDTFVIVLVLVGFPLALILSWAYDLTPTGIKRPQNYVNHDLRNFGAVLVSARKIPGTRNTLE